MEFTDRCTTAFAADSHKRVLYSYGLVLGVGEFRTEQNYFLEKARGHNRALHGYGTIAGLAVTSPDTPNGPEVRVSPGLAIDPRGREICVRETQCALLDDWLQERRRLGEPSPPVDGSPPSDVTAYVVLCYRECETDRVPVPVGPCQSLDKTALPSRIEEAFELRLLDTPPAQVEADAIRRLADLFFRVRIQSAAGALTTPDALIAEIRGLLSVPSPPDEVSGPGSPPAELVLDPQFAREILRAAWRVWVTEVRPQLVAEGGGCLKGPRDETCVLLARLHFDTQEAGGRPRVAGSVEIDQEERPFLLPTGLIQEFLMFGGGWSDLDPGALPILGGPRPLGAGPQPRPRGPSTISLAGASARPLNRTASLDLLDGVPTLRFGRTGRAALAFAPPRDVDTAAPLRVRLHWAYQRGTAAAPPVTWRASLRFLTAGENVAGGPPAGAPARLIPRVAGDQRERLLVTDFVELARALPADSSLATLVIELDTTAAADRNSQFFLLAAELSYTPKAIS